MNELLLSVALVLASFAIPSDCYRVFKVRAFFAESLPNVSAWPRKYTTAAVICQEIRGENNDLIGYDCEWLVWPQYMDCVRYESEDPPVGEVWMRRAP